MFSDPTFEASTISLRIIRCLEAISGLKRGQILKNMEWVLGKHKIIHPYVGGIKVEEEICRVKTAWGSMIILIFIVLFSMALIYYGILVGTYHIVLLTILLLCLLSPLMIYIIMHSSSIYLSIVKVTGDREKIVNFLKCMRAGLPEEVLMPRHNVILRIRRKTGVVPHTKDMLDYLIQELEGDYG